MQVYKVDITSWTASFRYPNLISGFQPTLDVPPLSTILGLINAASGSYQFYKDFKIGYYFEYEMKAVDLETIYQISGKDGKPSNNAKSNIINRQFLFNTFLRLYIFDEYIVNFFRQPFYQLLLGRMNDLASVENIQLGEVESIETAEYIRGQIIPFKHFLPGQIQALPKYFTDTFPRNNIGTEPYSVISHDASPFSANISAYRDEIKPKHYVDIYFHNLDLRDYA